MQEPAKSGGYWFAIAAGAVVVGITAAWGGYAVWQSQQGIKVSGDALEAQIVDQYDDLAGSHLALAASCPSSPRLRKDKTVDCTVRREDNGGASPVFVTPTDNSGHFRMQLGNPTVLINFP